MKKKAWMTRGLILAAAVSLSACGAFKNESAGGRADYAPQEAAYEEADYEYGMSYDEAADVAYYMDDSDAIAMAPRMMASETSAKSAGNASGSGEKESGSGSDNKVTQTTAGGADDDGENWNDVPPQSDEKDAPDGGTESDSVKKRKLITTVSIDAETEKMDDILQRVESEVAAFGGYIESSYISQDRAYVGNNTYTNRRRATMTLRVPESKLETVLSVVSGETNVLEESRTTEDITLTYVDIESRKKSLETQRDSLLRLLEQAETVEDIITIEDRLSYVNYEIERMGGQLRSYDNLVDYATIHLTLREVVEYTPVQEEPETVFSRIAKGFSYNLKRVGGGIVDFFVWFVSSLPQIAVFAVVIAAAVKILKWLKKRRDARRTAKGEDKTARAPKEKKGLRGLFGKKKQVAQTAPADNTAGQQEDSASGTGNK